MSWFDNQKISEVAEGQNRLVGNALNQSNVPTYIQDLRADIERLEYKIDLLLRQLGNAR